MVTTRCTIKNKSHHFSQRLTTRKNLNTTRYWGYHLIVNAGKCDPVAIRSKSTIESFAKALVKKIRMKAFGPPKVVRFGQCELLGNTLVQLIETSNITAHFVESSNDVYLDVFSCKPFNKQHALDVFKEFFKPVTIEMTFLERQAKH